MPNYKVGLEYFELDCHFDEKVRLIQAEFGLKGIAVIVLLFKEIYGGQGYYMTWSDERLLLLMSENGVAGGDHNLIAEIVSACIKRNIFSKELFDKYRILTSSGIQKRYLHAVSRRGKVEVKKEYLLVSVDKNKVIVNNIADNVNNIAQNVCNNSQSRVEKSREDSNSIKDTICPSSEDGRIIAEWNTLSRYGIRKVMKIEPSSQRGKWFAARKRQYTENDFMTAIDNIRHSKFLQGNNKRGWAITFDWFVRTSNFPKVLEGNYNDDNQSSDWYSDDQLDNLLND